MADDDEWWSGVSQRSDDLRVERPHDPLTDPLPDPLTDPLPPAADRDVTLPMPPVEADPMLPRADALTADPLLSGPAAADRLPAPPPPPAPTSAGSIFDPAPLSTVVHEVVPAGAALPVLDDPLEQTPPAPVAAAAPPAPPAAVAPPPPAALHEVLDDDGEVPFWLLPPPPRPTAPAAAARPVAPGPAAAAPPAGPVAGGVADLFGPREPGTAPTVPGRLGQAAPYAVRQAPAGLRPAGRTPGQGGPAAGLKAALPAVAAQLERAGRSVGPLAARAREQARSLPRTWVVAGAAAAVGLVVVVLAISALTGGDGSGSQATRSTPAEPAATPSPIDLTTVEATATSVQKAEGSTGYTAANTLDGKLATAWNSNGKADGPGPGITLRYTFAEPVDLRSVSIANGYQKVVKSGGKNRDLYAANSRLKQVKVVTDAGEWTWTLQDSKAPQALRKAMGTTKTVTIEILSVYKGKPYTDVAISEVAFTGIAKG